MAGWAASKLPKLNYYYVPLAQTNTKYEGDALLINPITNHGIVIQNNAALKVLKDEMDMFNLLTEYQANTQLLSYGVYEHFWDKEVIEQRFRLLKKTYDQGYIHMDCVSMVMHTEFTQGVGRALDIEEAIAMHSVMLDMSTYNKFTAAYFNTLSKPELLHTEALTDGEVIQEFTRGLRIFLGHDQVVTLSEM